jgi:hypothetical protein
MNSAPIAVLKPFFACQRRPFRLRGLSLYCNIKSQNLHDMGLSSISFFDFLEMPRDESSELVMQGFTSVEKNDHDSIES